MELITNFLNDKRYTVRGPFESENTFVEIVADFSEENKKIQSHEFNEFLKSNNLKMERLCGCIYGIYQTMPITHSLLPTSLEMNDDTFNQLWLLRPSEPNMIKMFNKLIEAPRRYKVYGKPYKFTGMSNNNINEVPNIVKPYLDYVNKLDNRYNYNSVLINWYEGENYIGFHSDNEKSIKQGTDIYSLSFGEHRVMRFKNIKTKQNTDYDLQHNEVIIMKYGCQELYQHSIPKSKKLTGKRINITIRCIT